MTAEEKRKAKEEIRAKNIAAFERFKKENPDWEKSSTKDRFEQLINNPEEYGDRPIYNPSTSWYFNDGRAIYNTNKPAPKTEEQKEEERVNREVNSLRRLSQKKKEEGLNRLESWEYQNLLRKYGDPDTWQDENINDDYDDADEDEDEDIYYDEEDDWEEEGHEDDDWEDYEDDVDESNYDPYLGQDVYDDGGDSWIEESRRYHNHLRETEVEDKEESEEKKDRDYYRNLYLSDPIDKSADIGNVRYIGDELGVPQYESAKRSDHWFEKLEKHLQEAQASDETFKKFWDLAEEEYGIK